LVLNLFMLKHNPLFQKPTVDILDMITKGTLGLKKEPEKAEKAPEVAARKQMPTPKKSILKKSKEELQRIREAELKKEREQREMNQMYKHDDVKRLYELVISNEPKEKTKPEIGKPNFRKLHKILLPNFKRSL
jgi:hypothetical protein